LPYLPFHRLDSYFNDRSPTQPPVRGLLRPLQEQTAAGKGSDTDPDPKNPSVSGPKDDPSKKLKEKPLAAAGVANKAFHIFECLDGVRSPNTDSIDEAALVELLREVDDYLAYSTSFTDRKEYRDCPEATRVSAYADMEKEGIELAKSKPRALVQQNYEDRIDIFNAADLVFSFFLPPSLEAPTVSKFWGAIHRVVQVGLL
jgi:hypothetical protein